MQVRFLGKEMMAVAMVKIMIFLSFHFFLASFLFSFPSPFMTYFLHLFAHISFPSLLPTSLPPSLPSSLPLLFPFLLPFIAHILHLSLLLVHISISPSPPPPPHLARLSSSYISSASDSVTRILVGFLCSSCPHFFAGRYSICSWHICFTFAVFFLSLQLMYCSVVGICRCLLLMLLSFVIFIC